MRTAIQVEQISKRYRISRGGNDYRTLRESLTNAALAPLRRLRNGGMSSKVQEFWALRDVSVNIRPGEVVGLVGRNGAGKSTFLKLLSRITRPTTGKVTLNGRVGSLLEVGTGFHPELSGRENIYLNGAILGMSRREIKSKFDEIVAFAEVEKFLDTAVKRYSSGMYVRLAFAVAAHLEPEILLVDEVLAVGDAAFQRKCMGKMGQVARDGRTILFVSHNMAAITRLCQRAIWFDGGQIHGSGPAEEIVSKYLAHGSEDAGEVKFHDNGSPAPGSDHIKLEAIRVIGGDGQVRASIDIRRPFALEIQYRVLRRAANFRVGIKLLAHDGTVLISSTDMDETEDEMMREPGIYTSRCEIPADFLNYGQYFVSVGCDFPMQQVHFRVDQGLSFTIEQMGGVGSHLSDGRSGLLRMRLPWQVNRVSE